MAEVTISIDDYKRLKELDNLSSVRKQLALLIQKAQFNKADGLIPDILAMVAEYERVLVEVVEERNVLLEGKNSLSTNNTELVLEITNAWKTIEGLEGVIEDKDVEIEDLEGEIEELRSALGEIAKENSELKEELEDLRTGERG